MDPLAQLRLVANRLLNDRTDLRHTVLDVSADFLATSDQLPGLPAVLSAELRDLRAEVAGVQPRFPSHRKTSVLFDEAGLGQPGRERANRIADRVVALVRQLDET